MKYCLAIAFLVLLVALENHARIYQRTHSIRPAGNYKLHPVKMVKECGGAGKINEFRDEECDEIEGSCVYYADGVPHEHEVDYTPSEDMEEVGFRATILPSTVFEDVKLPASAVKKGKKYTIRNEYVIETNEKGVKKDARIEVYNGKTGVVDACIMAPIKIV